MWGIGHTPRSVAGVSCFIADGPPLWLAVAVPRTLSSWARNPAGPTVRQFLGGHVGGQPGQGSPATHGGPRWGRGVVDQRDAVMGPRRYAYLTDGVEVEVVGLVRVAHAT